MTSSALTRSRPRAVLDVLLAGLVGVVAPYLVALGWAVLAAAVWGPGPRLAGFVDPSAGRPAAYVIAWLLFSVVAGALLGAGLARALGSAGAGRFRLWAALAVGIVLSVAHRDTSALGQPVVLLFIASSALGFQLRVRG